MSGEKDNFHVMEYEALKIACAYSWNCEKSKIYGISNDLYDFLKTEIKEMTTEKINEIKKKLKILDTYKIYCEIRDYFYKDMEPFSVSVVLEHWKLGSRIKFFHNYTVLLPILNLPFQNIDIELLEKCFIIPAKVIKKESNNLMVIYKGMYKNELTNELNIHSRFTKKRMVIDNVVKSEDFSKAEIRENDLVVIHFDSAIEILAHPFFTYLNKLLKSSLIKFNRQRKNIFQKI